jgi:hypothetical protein
MVTTTLVLAELPERDALPIAFGAAEDKNRRSPGEPSCAPPGCPTPLWDAARGAGSCTVCLQPLVNPLRRPDFPAHLTVSLPADPDGAAPAEAD